METLAMVMIALGAGGVLGLLGGIAEKVIDKIFERRLADYED